MKAFWVFICFLLIVFAVEFTAGLFTQSSVSTWYTMLAKPTWTPPPWVFGPVWTLLYILMAVGVFLVWRAKGSFAAYFFWGLQLFLNFTWSLSFFYLKNPLLGLINLAALWVVLLISIALFARHSKLAATLQIPYALWSSYALALNGAIWWLNRGA